MGKPLGPSNFVRAKVFGGVLIAVALNVAIGYLGWHFKLVARTESDSVARLPADLSLVKTLLVQVLDAQIDAGDFAFSGNDVSLAQCYARRQPRGTDMGVLRELAVKIPRRPRKHDGLREMLQPANASSDEVAWPRRTGKVPAPDIFKVNQRRADAVRTANQTIENQGQTEIHRSLERSRSVKQLARIVIFCGTLLGIAIITLAAILLHGKIRKNTKLQHHLEQRTGALQAENVRSAETDQQLRASREIYRLMLDGIHDYAVYMLNPEGEVASWNTGAARIKGYESDEILGKHFSCFYVEAERIQNLPEKALAEAVQAGRHEHRGWRMRKDGSVFWGSSVITPMYDEKHVLRGYSKVVCDITERKRSEDRLLESQQQLAAVIQSAMDAVITAGEDQRIVLFNGTAEIMFGCPAAEAIGKSLDIFIPARFRGCHSGYIRTFADTGESGRSMGTSGPLYGVRLSGDEFPIEASISQVEVDGKKLFTAIVRDVTDRERTQAALREQAQVLDLAQIFVRDLNGAIVTWNLGAQQLYGFTKEEALGRQSRELLHTLFPAPLQELEEILYAGGRWEGELSQRKRDGSRIAVSSVWVLHRDQEARPVRILEANVDITARKQAQDDLLHIERALRLQTRLLHSILDSIGEGLVAVDENGKIVLSNPAAESILGKVDSRFPLGTWEEQDIYRTDGITPFPAAELPLACALTGQPSTAEMVVRNPKLDLNVWIEASARPLADEGRMSGAVVAFRDITQRKNDECEIRKLNNELEDKVSRRTAQLESAIKELEAFTYSVSHDLRAPLRHIAGFTSMLIEDSGPQLDERARRFIQRIQDSTQMMGQMVDELLSLARVGKQPLNLQITGLNSIVNEVLGILKPDFGGRAIQLHVSPLPFVECDPTLIRLVFQNLISNALKYSRPRSPAVIEIGKDPDDVFFVRDNGVGFSMKYADKLFGVFQRLHRAEDFEGTGVGLATAHRILQKHGGRIWAEAELDRGATFFFTLTAPGSLPTAEHASSEVTYGAG